MQFKKAIDPLYDVDLDLQEAHHGSIMIVDDEPDIIDVIRQSLERDGFKVCSFTNASLALEHFNSNPQRQNHDAVISDIRMPGMNGYELAKRVKSTNSEVKVILMSAFEIEYGNNIKELLDLVPDIKIDAFIQKPFSILSLIDTINSI